MAGCFEAGAPATESSCHRPSDDSQHTPEDCPYQIRETSPAEGKFDPGWDASLDRLTAVDLLSDTRTPASRITPVMPPVVDDDYFHKLTVLLV